ncbi:hypothetical protein SOV99_12865 [Pectobacterium aroidearum]
MTEFLVEEFYSIKILTAERLSLLGGSLALIALPFTQKIKGLGIERERMVDSQ